MHAGLGGGMTAAWFPASFSWPSFFGCRWVGDESCRIWFQEAFCAQKEHVRRASSWIIINNKSQKERVKCFPANLFLLLSYKSHPHFMWLSWEWSSRSRWVEIILRFVWVTLSILKWWAYSSNDGSSNVRVHMYDSTYNIPFRSK